MNEEDFWLIAYITSLHAMLPRDEIDPLTVAFSNNARDIANKAVEHFHEMRRGRAAAKGENYP